MELRHLRTCDCLEHWESRPSAVCISPLDGLSALISQLG